MKKRYTIPGALLSCLLVIGSAMPASAGTNSDPLHELAKLNPGATASQRKSSISNYAEEQGITFKQATDQVLSEGRQSVAKAKPAKGSNNRLATTASSGGSTTGVYLGVAQRKGDLFVSPAATGFVQHGHTGIYYSTSAIIEAPGVGKKSRSISVSSYRVGRGAVKQYVRATSTQRSNAAGHAYNKLRYKDYNTNFAFNKYVNASKMNCSQLVWAAYRAATGIDLDGNGGPGVYPYNIKDSSKTVTYRVL